MKKMAVPFGSDIGDTIRKAKQLANEEKTEVQFKFSGILCRVNYQTNVTYLFNDYMNAFVMDWKVVGPICKPYSKEEKESIDKRKAESERQHIKDQIKVLLDQL